MIVNARMYSVAPAAKEAWRALLEWVLEHANVRMEFVEQEPPATLADLWARSDLGCVMMCGLPYRKVVGNLVNARGIIQALIDGRIDVGPLDGYVRDLIRRNDPAFAAKVRIIAVTEAAPMPPLIVTAALDPDAVGRMRKAFLSVEHAPDLAKVRATLLLRRLAIPEPSAYDVFHGILQASEQYAGVW